VTEDRWNGLGGKKVQSDGTHGRSNVLMAYMELLTFIMAYMEKTLPCGASYRRGKPRSRVESRSQGGRTKKRSHRLSHQKHVHSLVFLVVGDYAPAPGSSIRNRSPKPLKKSISKVHRLRAPLPAIRNQPPDSTATSSASDSSRHRAPRPPAHPWSRPRGSRFPSPARHGSFARPRRSTSTCVVHTRRPRFALSGTMRGSPMKGELTWSYSTASCSKRSRECPSATTPNASPSDIDQEQAAGVTE
jgi:hypothetical protein